MLSGVLHGARISLVVGLAAAGSVLIGVVVAPSPATGGGDWMPTAPTIFSHTHATMVGLTHVDAERHRAPFLPIAAIRAATPARTILSSDCGVSLLPPPAEVFREYLLLVGSVASNRRTDAYGGDLDGRMPFGLEAVAAVRKAVGASAPACRRMAWSRSPILGLTPPNVRQSHT